jgi:hypothetical protein
MHSPNQFAANKNSEPGTQFSFPNLHSVGNKVLRSEKISLWREFYSLLQSEASIGGTSKFVDRLNSAKELNYHLPSGNAKDSSDQLLNS